MKVAALLILVLITLLVHPNSSQVVKECIAKSENFTEHEDQYVDRRNHPETEPNLPGPQIEELQHKVYDMEKRQRPFECISNRTGGSPLSPILLDLNYIKLVQSCEREQPNPNCKLFETSEEYQTFDGTCNNRLNPKQGRSLTCLGRYLPQVYEGVSGFRQSVCGGPLPDPRTVSLQVHPDRNIPTQIMTHVTIFFGQVIAHDLSDIPITYVDTEPIDCCSQPPGKNQHPQCAPILLKSNDPFYGPLNVTCFDFVRASICDTCKLGKRNQINQATSYLDASGVYGVSDTLNKQLRSTNKTGELESRQFSNGEELPPPDRTVDFLGGCGRGDELKSCLLTGDRRTNQHAPLMALQTLFLREHNRIARELSKANPRWNDEKVFQEARRINIAQIQVIIYKEFLPLIIGKNLMSKYRLNIDDPSLYNVNVDATVKAEFNVAAYRLHSGLNGIVAQPICTAEELRNLFQNAEPLYQGNTSCLVKGICESPAQQYDRWVTRDMTDFMYRAPKGNYGFDIAAVNIQRGRDAGLQSYTEVLKHFSKKVIETFDDLSSIMDENSIKALKDTYCDVRDIDLWVGINNEKVEGDMFVGPTAGQIIAKQFSELMRGDRFFFKHNRYLNKDKKATLKNASLARIICDNTNIMSIQKDAMRAESSSNPMTNCNSIPKVDLCNWSSCRQPLTIRPTLPTIRPTLPTTRPILGDLLG